MKKIILIVIGVIIIGLAGFGGLVWFFLKKFQEPVTEQEQAWVVGASELVPYFDGFSPQAENELLTRLRILGRLVELNYEYESEAESEPYISTSVSEKGGVLGAKKDMLIQWKAFELTVKTYGMEVRENNDFYQVGDNSRFADLIVEEEVLGHILIARKEDFLYMFTISGFIMPDPDIWHELFDHRIESLE